MSASHLDDAKLSSSPVLAFWVPPWLRDDGIFDPKHPQNRDDQYHPMRVLRYKLAQLGWRIHTQDVVKRSREVPRAVLFFDIPRLPISVLLGSWARKVTPYAILFECETVKARNWNPSRHKQFQAIFTWHSRLVDNSRYIRTFYSQHFDPSVSLNRDLSNKHRLCVMIAGNKRSRGRQSLDLYSKRLEAICWYETHHPFDFDLYGTGWDDARVPYSFRLRRLGLMGLVNALVGTERRPSYRGTLDQKRPTLERYRFNICFENARDIPGYITEKLFDSFLGSCVPVYWGAPDITDFVPKDCFIDFRDYMDLSKLHRCLSMMSDAEYLSYLDRIEQFLRSPAIKQFTSDYWAEAIANTVAGRRESVDASCRRISEHECYP